MKNLFISMLFLAGTSLLQAQTEKQDEQQESIQDKIQQEPPPNTQIDLERRSRIEAQRIQNEKAALKREKILKNCRNWNKVNRK